MAATRSAVTKSSSMRGRRKIRARSRVCPEIHTRGSSSASDQTIRCRMISRGGTATSRRQYKGLNPQMRKAAPAHSPPASGPRF